MHYPYGMHFGCVNWFVAKHMHHVLGQVYILVSDHNYNCFTVRANGKELEKAALKRHEEPLYTMSALVPS